MKFPTLHFPAIEPRIQESEAGLRIWDAIRSRYVALTPEEWVRQHCIQWLISRGYPAGRCSVERQVARTTTRYDIVWMDAQLQAFLIVECKAPSVKLTPDTLRQGAWYNLTVAAPYLMITNGIASFCAAVNTGGQPEFLADIPPYPIPTV